MFGMFVRTDLFYAFICTHTVVLRTDNEGCHTLKTEDECVASKDGRAGSGYHGNPCHWCCGDPCTYGGNKCEPSGFVERKRVFQILSRNGEGHNNCAAAGEDSVVCMMASI